MIDIQPHLDKLDRLKEYMDAKIDSKGEGVWIDIYSLDITWKQYTVNELIELFFQTGVLLGNSNQQQSTIRKVTFEEYLQLNN